MMGLGDRVESWVRRLHGVLDPPPAVAERPPSGGRREPDEAAAEPSPGRTGRFARGAPQEHES
jgi:hypothetical protein